MKVQCNHAKKCNVDSCIHFKAHDTIQYRDKTTCLLPDWCGGFKSVTRTKCIHLVNATVS
jgi:hypothetical protein